ncbi:hypothetical protein DTO212C5_3267 [Paecilomyces variotii]|nr:hypothetical protein DTO212C5_3267 [Paecilomyces variotii]
MQSTEGDNNTPIEVDYQTTGDESYEDRLSAYSASLTSSVTNYRHENGRRYHAYDDGRYLLPNDEHEQDRLDIHHALCKQILDGKLLLAPIENPQRVLDLGTGTGIWAIEFADQYQSAEVIGCDLSPVQPAWVPPNVQFYIDNIEKDWNYESPFNFIHARYLAVAMEDYAGLVKKAYQHVKPGSWVEFQDWDQYPFSEDKTLENTNMEKYFAEVIGAFAEKGYEASPGPKLEHYFKAAGFQDVHVEKFRVPLGIWPKSPHLKTIGTWMMLQGEEGYEAGAMAILTRYKGWSEDEVRVLVDKTRKDAKDRDIHTQFHFYVVYGRKPE